MPSRTRDPPAGSSRGERPMSGRSTSPWSTTRRAALAFPSTLTHLALAGRRHRPQPTHGLSTIGSCRPRVAGTWWAPGHRTADRCLLSRQEGKTRLAQGLRDGLAPSPRLPRRQQPRAMCGPALDQDRVVQPPVRQSCRADVVAGVVVSSFRYVRTPGVHNGYAPSLGGGQRPIGPDGYAAQPPASISRFHAPAGSRHPSRRPTNRAGARKRRDRRTGAAVGNRQASPTQTAPTFLLTASTASPAAPVCAVASVAARPGRRCTTGPARTPMSWCC